MTLHEAIEKVLKESGRPMSAAEIADVVNKQGLYSRGDKNPVPSSQIHARVNNYPEWFNKTDKGLISLATNRIDIFDDIVIKLFGILKGKPVNDINFLIPALIFYKRWTDTPDFLSAYKIEIKADTENKFTSSAFYSFYEQLGKMSGKTGKLFNLRITDNFAADKQFLFKESLMALEEALNALSFVSVGYDILSANDFGEKFSELFTKYFVNIKTSGEYSTPDTLSELLINLEPVKEGQTIYNPAAGYFTFLIDINRGLKDKVKFYAEEVNPLTFSLGLMNLIANGCSVDNISLEDSLNASVIKDESADIVICNPPLGQKDNQSKYTGLFPFKSRYSILYFLQHALKKANPAGTVIMVVPESILFSQERGVLAFRKYIVDNNLLETVISLPSGTFAPYTMVKASIVILKKRKTGSKALFFDVDQPDYCSKDSKGQVTLKIKNILTSLQKLGSGETISFRNKTESLSPVSLVMEKASLYGLNPEYFVFTDLKDISRNNYDLEVKRYFLEDISYSDTDYKNQNLVELKSILTLYKNPGRDEAINNMPIIHISNLQSDLINYKSINFEELKCSTQPSQILDRTVLLVGSIEGRLKPTIFEYTGVRVAISHDIYAFIPDYSKVDEEYLIYELAGQNVRKQVEALSHGSVFKRITLSDFLRIKINLQGLSEQKDIARNRKEGFLQSMINEPGGSVEQVKQVHDLEKKMLGSLRHELSPLASSMKGGLKTLQSYLGKAAVENRAPSFSDKISGAKSSRTLEELLSDMEKSASDLLLLSDSIQSIIEVGKTDLSQEVEILKFFRQEVETWEFKDEYNIVYHGEDESGPDLNLNIDKKQFSILIRNFLENTHKHGFHSGKEISGSGSDQSKNIVFNAYREEETAVIELINDGEKMPPDFTFDDFISFGGRGGINRGSGIGGYLMNRIVQSHNGELIMIEPGKSLIIPSEHKTKEKGMPSKHQIIAGVYFRIILPLNNH